MARPLGVTSATSASTFSMRQALWPRPELGLLVVVSIALMVLLLLVSQRVTMAMQVD